MNKTQSTSYLRRRRRILVKRLISKIPHILRGSLLERYKRCGKQGCRCADGPGHGPKYYLSISQPGRRPEMDYIPQASKQQVEQCLTNLQEVRRISEEICNINREILRRKEGL